MKSAGAVEEEKPRLGAGLPHGRELHMIALPDAGEGKDCMLDVRRALVPGSISPSSSTP